MPGERVTVPTLVMTGGALDGTAYPLPMTGREVVMGSSMDAGVQIMLGNVEPFHAKLIFTQTGLAIADAGSATGTFVNGEKVDGEQPLQAGDRVCLGPPGAKGSAKLLVFLPGAGESPTLATGMPSLQGMASAVPTGEAPALAFGGEAAAARPPSTSAPRRRPDTREMSRSSRASPAGGPARADAPRAGSRSPSGIPAGTPARAAATAPAASRTPPASTTTSAAAPAAAGPRGAAEPARPEYHCDCRRFPWNARPRPRSSRRCGPRRARLPSRRPARPKARASRRGPASRCRRSRWCRSSAAPRLSRSWALSSGSSCCARRRPELAAVTPTTVGAGEAVTLAGKNFGKDAASNSVFFGPTKAQITEASPTAIRVVVPAGAEGAGRGRRGDQPGPLERHQHHAAQEATTTGVSPDVVMPGQTCS